MLIFTVIVTPVLREGNVKLICHVDVNKQTLHYHEIGWKDTI